MRQSRLYRFLQCFVLVGMFASAGMLSGCNLMEDDPYMGAPIQPTLTFSQFQPIFLNVAEIEFIEEYKSPKREPNIEHLLPIMPAEAMRIWVKDRIRPVGLDNKLQVIIRDGSVKAVDLPPQNDGMMAEYFSSEPGRRYDARLEVELRLYSEESTMSEASVVVVATQSSTIPTASNLQERKLAFMNILYQLMQSANAELEKQIFHYFTHYIIYAKTP